MEAQNLFGLVFVIGMFAGVFVIYMAMRQRSHQMEMQHRERMAMIERGQVPTDPPNLVHRLVAGGPPRSSGSGSRSLSLGIIVVAVGLGLMTIIGIAGGSPETGVGIGGAITIVGLAFIVNSVVTRQATSAHDHAAPPPPDDRPLM